MSHPFLIMLCLLTFTYGLLCSSPLEPLLILQDLMFSCTFDMLLYMLLSPIDMLPPPEAIPTYLSRFHAGTSSPVRPFSLLGSLDRMCFSLLCIAIRLHVYFYHNIYCLGWQMLKSLFSLIDWEEIESRVCAIYLLLLFLYYLIQCTWPLVGSQ